MGAKLKKYTTNWDSLQISTIIIFLYDNQKYELYRNRESFILDDGNEVRFFASISELKKFYVDFFEFHIKMPVKKEKSD